METQYTMKQACEILDVEQHTLRYMEKILDLKIQRDSTDNRIYTPEDIELLLDVKDLKDQGYTYKAIKEQIKHKNNTSLANTENTYKTEFLNQNTTRIIETLVNEFLINKINEIANKNKEEIAADLAEIKDMQQNMTTNMKNIHEEITASQQNHYDDIDKKLVDLKVTLQKRQKENKHSWLSKFFSKKNRD